MMLTEKGHVKPLRQCRRELLGISSPDDRDLGDRLGHLHSRRVTHGAHQRNCASGPFQRLLFQEAATKSSSYPWSCITPHSNTECWLALIKLLHTQPFSTWCVFIQSPKQMYFIRRERTDRGRWRAWVFLWCGPAALSDWTWFISQLPA